MDSGVPQEEKLENNKISSMCFCCFVHFSACLPMASELYPQESTQSWETRLVDRWNVFCDLNKPNPWLSYADAQMYRAVEEHGYGMQQLIWFFLFAISLPHSSLLLSLEDFSFWSPLPVFISFLHLLPLSPSLLPPNHVRKRTKDWRKVFLERCLLALLAWLKKVGACVFSFSFSTSPFLSPLTLYRLVCFLTLCTH